jgi:hypothetical protein
MTGLAVHLDLGDLRYNVRPRKVYATPRPAGMFP